MKGKILIAGVGNIFLGDDAFGVEVALLLSRRRLAANLVVKDFGIRGFDLAFALLDPWDAVIIVDTLQRGEAAGTLCVLEPDLAALSAASSAETAINPHGMDPVRVLTHAASLGPITAQVLVLGCEPLDFGDELQGRMGLSPAIRAVTEQAADMAVDLSTRLTKTKLEPLLAAAPLQTIER